MMRMLKRTPDSGRRTKQGNPAIMTPPASMLADEVAPKPQSTTTVNGKNVQCIHNPLG